MNKDTKHGCHKTQDRDKHWDEIHKVIRSRWEQLEWAENHRSGKTHKSKKLSHLKHKDRKNTFGKTLYKVWSSAREQLSILSHTGLWRAVVEVDLTVFEFSVPEQTKYGQSTNQVKSLRDCLLKNWGTDFWNVTRPFQQHWTTERPVAYTFHNTFKRDWPVLMVTLTKLHLWSNMFGCSPTDLMHSY